MTATEHGSIVMWIRRGEALGRALYRLHAWVSVRRDAMTRHARRGRVVQDMGATPAV